MCCFCKQRTTMTPACSQERVRMTKSAAVLRQPKGLWPSCGCAVAEDADRARCITDDRETGSRSRSHIGLCGTWLERLHGAGGAADREGCETGVRAVVVQHGHVDADGRADAPGKPLAVTWASSLALSRFRLRRDAPDPENAHNRDVQGGSCPSASDRS